MIELPELVLCVYCGSDARLFEKGARHRYDQKHGPFDIYQCRSCGSLFTFPSPSLQQITELYSKFSKGMHEKITGLRTSFPLHAWFRQCLDHMITGVNTRSGDFSWIDAGAGDGIMSELMYAQFPSGKGIAIDFHDKPERLDKTNVQWVKGDLNKELVRLEKADLVFAITVLEHVAEPHEFIINMLNCLKPGGVLYLNCPRADSWAFKLFGKKWPYYLAGEHLTVPSIRGLQILMEKSCKEVFPGPYTLQIQSVTMPYPLGYYLGYFFSSRKTSFQFNPDIYLPTGMLECKLKLNDQD